MNLDAFFNFFSLFTVSLGVKIFLLTLIFFYSVFAFITLRQTQLMSEILNLLNFSPLLKLISTIHFLAAITLFVLAGILFLF